MASVEAKATTRAKAPHARGTKTVLPAGDPRILEPGRWEMDSTSVHNFTSRHGPGKIDTPIYGSTVFAMKSDLFSQANLESQTTERFALQNPQLLRVSLGTEVLAVKGSMVAYQGQIKFDHEKTGSMGKLLKKMVSSDDVPLMRVSGQGEVFFADTAGFVFLVHLENDALSVSGQNLLAFDASLNWDLKRLKGANMMTGGLFNMELSGTGTVALHAVGQPVVLDCAQQPTYVDVNAAVAWSSNLQPQIVSSMNMASMLRGGSGEAFQYAYHGPGFVVVQPSEWGSGTSGSSGGSTGGSSGGLLGDLFS